MKDITVPLGAVAPDNAPPVPHDDSHARLNAVDHVSAGLVMNMGIREDVPYPRATFDIECIGADGEVKWRETIPNLVTTVGKNFNLDTVLKGSAYTAAWFLVLAGAGTKAVGDTLASHAGWAELTPYAGTNRYAITWGTTSGGSNTSATIAVAVNATATVAGAGICTSQAIATTSGTLYNVGDFSTARSVISGDQLNVTIQITVT